MERKEYILAYVWLTDHVQQRPLESCHCRLHTGYEQIEEDCLELLIAAGTDEEMKR